MLIFESLYKFSLYSESVILICVAFKFVDKLRRYDWTTTTTAVYIETLIIVCFAI